LLNFEYNKKNLKTIVTKFELSVSYWFRDGCKKRKLFTRWGYKIAGLGFKAKRFSICLKFTWLNDMTSINNKSVLGGLLHAPCVWHFCMYFFFSSEHK